MKNIRIFAAAKRKMICLSNQIGVWCSWLAFLHGVQAVARSSRATPTKEQQILCCSFCLSDTLSLKQQKRTPLRMSFFLSVVTPLILPQALFEVEHFVLDAL